MSNFQPTLTINEGIATGWARVEIYGKTDAEVGYAKGRIGDGRKVLGMLKSIHGVGQEQVDNNQRTGGGGFFHIERVLTDGTKIVALTNDGHDTIRIYPPSFEEKVDDTKKREDDFEPGDYLWVGVRVKDGCVRPSSGLDVWLVEPGGTAYRGIVGAAFSDPTWFGGQAHGSDATGSDEFGWDLIRRAGSTQAVSLDSFIADFYDGYASIGYSPDLQPGDHQGYSGVYTPEGRLDINWSANGVMFQHGSWLYDQLDAFTSVYGGPHDPLMTPEQNNGGDRTFAGRVEPPEPGEAVFGWDAVFWLDPYDEKLLAKYPTMKNIDKRPLVRELRSLLRDEGFLLPPRQQVKAGGYVLLVRANGDPPRLMSTRTSETIPPPAGTELGPGFDQRSQYCDYSDYMETVNDYPPLEVEVEVRLGRNILTMREPLPDPDEITVGLPSRRFNFDLTCEIYESRDVVAHPTGFDVVNNCTREGGPNMGGPSFAQAVIINVKAGSAELGDVSAAAPVFAGQEWLQFLEFERRRARFFIYVAFPQPSVAEWQANAGIAMHTAMEMVTNGTYGCSEMASISSAALQALFAGTSQIDGVFMFDPVAHTVTNVGNPSSTPDTYSANDPPLDSTNFYWYYEKAVAYQNDCYNTYGIAVTTAGNFYEFAQDHTADPNFTDPDCCAG